MSKGEETRAEVIRKASVLFNKRGFAGVSMSELMAATGLKKGGIYNHFSSKEEIMAEAFRFAFERVTSEVARVMKQELTAEAKLRSVVEFYRTYPLNPTIEGGCPVVNSCVESDDANPLLREKVQQAMDILIQSVVSVVQRGIRRGEFPESLDPEVFAIGFIAQIDGGILMSRAYGQSRYMDVVCDQLHRMIDAELA